MPKGEDRTRHGRELRALLLSLPALAIPVIAAFVLPAALEDYEALLWLLALIPAFLLANHRGWRGVATGLALGMAVISATYALAQWTGSRVPDLLLAVVVAYIAIALGIGWLSEVRARRRGSVMDDVEVRDPLTELPLRRQAEAHLARELAAASPGRSLSVVLFDLDNFAAFNEANGRAAGDGVLRGFGTLLRQSTRRMNLSARYGAEEFVCVLSGCDEVGATIFATRMQERLRAAESTVALPTVSAGIASYRGGLETPAQLLRAAEDALLLAKEAGRDRVRVHGGPAGVVAGEAADAATLPPLAVTPVEGGAAGPVGAGHAALVLAGTDALRRELAATLQAEGFAVAETASWAEALPRLTGEFTVALVELAPGAANAGDVVRELRARVPDVRVIGVPHGDGAAEAAVYGIPVHGFHLPASPPARLRALLRELVRDVVAERARAAQARALREESRAREREARDAASASEAKYHDLLQTIQQVIFTADADGRWTFLNPAWTAITGYNVEESLEQPLWAGVHDEDRDALREGFERLMRLRAAHFRHEGRWRTRAGEYRWIEARFQYSPVGGGGASGVLTDVTERRIAEQALRQTESALGRAQRMESIGRLAGGVAHDFNNLLTAVLGHAELLLEETPADQTMLRTGLLEIRHAAERATLLTRQLLAFSRRQVLQPRVVDLNLVVAELEPVLRHSIGEGCELVPELSAPLDLVRADPAQLEQVVLNLAVNARDATDGSGRIVVRTRNRVVHAGEALPDPEVSPGDYVMLEVEDDGAGMSGDVAAQAFEPFFTTRPGDGSGLGLSTVYGIVKQSGGHVWLTSEPGRGTRVTVYLPRASQPAEETLAPAEETSAAGGSETILLVEDEQSVRELAQRVLERRGYRVLTAANGREALELATSLEAPIDLLLSDVVMPELQGPQLADRLSPQRPEMRVLLMSGYAEDAVRARDALGPGRSFLEKPFAPDALLARVRAVLDAGPQG